MYAYGASAPSFLTLDKASVSGIGKPSGCKNRDLFAPRWGPLHRAIYGRRLRVSIIDRTRPETMSLNDRSAWRTSSSAPTRTGSVEPVGAGWAPRMLRSSTITRANHGIVHRCFAQSLLPPDGDRPHLVADQRVAGEVFSPASPTPDRGDIFAGGELASRR